MGRRVVYISYDGMEDPLGKSQVLPYLEALAARGHQFELVSFEKPPHATQFRKEVGHGIRSTRLRYHKTPTVPATAFDMLQGLSALSLLGLVRRADLVHVRSYVAGALALPFVIATRRPFLFDMRGLWPEERVADGTWSETGRVFKGAKEVEKLLVKNASAITVLTNDMAHYLRHEAPFATTIKAPIQVIPTCTNLSRFTPEVPPDPELARVLAGHRVLAYVGSFGKRYLSAEMARFYLAWRRVAGPARFLVVSRQSPVEMQAVLDQAGVGHELVHRAAEHDQVPAFVRCAEAGVFFHPEVFANRGAAPTKMGEMLAAGLPLAGNRIGDVEEVLTRHDAGVVLEGFDDDELTDAALRLAGLARSPGVVTRARRTAEEWFSLERGVLAYDELYQKIRWEHGFDIDRSWPR